MQQLDVGLLVLRAVFGVFLAYHGYNKVFGGGGLAGTARWFGSIGMKWPLWPDQGWEYRASITVVALVVATTGPGRWSLDHALGIHFSGWSGALLGGLLGIGGALAQLALSYRPKVSP